MTESDTLSSRRSTFTYRAFLTCALVCAAIAITFFVIGIADGSVSSFNMGLWMVILTALGAVPLTGFTLHSRGKIGPAVAILGIVAVPGFLAGLFFLLLIILQPRWN